jgi:hypothetical protein
MRAMITPVVMAVGLVLLVAVALLIVDHVRVQRRRAMIRQLRVARPRFKP